MSGSRRVAFVTGAGRGLGRALCVRLAEDGIDIMGVDIDEQIASVDYALSTPADLEETARLVRAAGAAMLARRADVRDSARLAAVVDEGLDAFGRLDIVCANAGISPWTSPVDDPETVWRDVIDVNLTGAWNTVREATPALVAGGRGGSIVFTSSVAGLRGLGGGTVAFNAYTASKHGLVGLMRTLARDLGRENIRVNSIHPGGIDTTMMGAEQVVPFMTAHPHFGETASPALPDGRLDPREVAQAVAWLVSDAASKITGVTLPVDAGVAL
ncbi:MAG: 3-ketoacyl-ACP reductase [Actinomycetia bacterium]|nr:3-ketoacyl-ACP reductase [Actinomycetes bacterium]